MKSNIVQDAENLEMVLSLLRIQINSVMAKVQESSAATLASRSSVPDVTMRLIKEIHYLKTIEDLIGKKPIVKQSDGSLNQGT